MGRTGNLPGTIDETTQELVDVAEKFFELDQVVAKKKKELKERKDDVLNVMKALHRKTFSDTERGLQITVTPHGETVKITKVRAPEAAKRKPRKKKDE